MQGHVSTRRQLHKYPNPYFVESGTFTGDGVVDAHRCGFKHIFSFEVVPALYEQCKKRFEGKEYSHVQLYLGTSAKMYGQCLEKIPGQITFWLDGHYSGIHEGKQTGFVETYCPLLQELDEIAKHP